MLAVINGRKFYIMGVFSLGFVQHTLRDEKILLRKHLSNHDPVKPLPLNLHSSDTTSKNSNKRANMKQKGHAQQHHHHHHTVLAQPGSPLGPPSVCADDDGAGDAVRCLRSPPTIGVHFAAPEDDDDEKRNKNDGSGRQQQPPSSPSRRRMTMAAATSATTGEETAQNGTATLAGAREQQQQQQLQTVPLRRAGNSREASRASRRRPRSGAPPSRGASAIKSPPAPLGRGSGGPLGGYVIQQGVSCRDGGNSSGLIGVGATASGGRGAVGHGGPPVR